MRRAAVATGFVTAALVVGCGAPSHPGAATAPSLAATTPAPRLIWSAANNAELAPGSVVKASATAGTVNALLVKDQSGKLLPTTGLASGTLPPDGTFTLAASATGPGGKVMSTLTVHTLPADHTLHATIDPTAGQTYGVGEPITVTFDTPVTDRAAVQRAMTVTASHPIGPAGWHWFSSTRVEYRPQKYWPANTTVTVHADLSGVQAGPTTFGTADTSSAFTIGRSQILVVSDATHQMGVFTNGVLVRTVPVSMGEHQGTWTTRSGIKTIMSIERTVRMDSATVGITGSGAYDEIVPYAMRLTWSGEYIHGAPWSVYAQGSYDVSHGCVNVSLDNAEWLYSNSLVGDVVDTTGTDRQMEWDGNGTGGVWNMPWATWMSGTVGV
ncbi:MAG TPA: Ig-like domain-containing protein [Frankiaceae bacterium]|jgi:lipoprotein-anchoring transpeptidase ErfK/SrfK|nr:Ig-like domain-containing protein [Frankiaceae bacterium]